ncbi:site-specific integrase [Aeromonas caviae]|uniref:tyrosine-type recombinase/integrase n=1 Tax=Aeromonas caviae TaxID=648 RepID=UPI0020B753C4|nr:site-specific integrase [Aeromonas caviae]MDX7770166.1 site-specific integrase [Aeromonas caviae]MDX7849210.1 site-specific integrase [Aeromonas caviae]UTI03328.1 site-specific integrase [Aeromonas caviae]
MASNKLNDKALRALQKNPTSKSQTIADGLSLSARVSPKGHIAWLFRYRRADSVVWLTLGAYPAMSLAQAREKRDLCRTLLADGKDPKIELERQQQEREHPVTLDDALNRWLADSKHVNGSKYRAQFTKWLAPILARPLSSLSQDDLIRPFHAMKLATGDKFPAVAAGYCLKNVQQALRHASRPSVRFEFDQRLLAIDVVDVGGKKQKAGERVLVSERPDGPDFSELADLMRWIRAGDVEPHAADWESYWGPMLQIIIHVGCRTGEIRLATCSEFDLDAGLWTVPKSHSKTDVEIIRPIPERLKPLIKSMTEGRKPSDPILGEIKRPEAVSQWGRGIYRRVSSFSGKQCKPWTLHDLRRTFSTSLNLLKVPPHIVESLLAHALGGVAGVYNKSAYLTEKKGVLDMWADELDGLVNKK